MVHRLKSEIYFTLDFTVGTHYFIQKWGTSPPLNQRFRWQSNAMSVATVALKTAETNSRQSSSHFALTKN